MRIMLDGITAEYLITSGLSERMRWASYKPGGEHYTTAEALKWALGAQIHCSVRKVAHEGGRSLRVELEDTINRDGMRSLLEAEIVFNGRVWAFDSMEACAEHYEMYGDPTTERWIEIGFKELV
jgi:hypothetical protein